MSTPDHAAPGPLPADVMLATPATAVIGLPERLTMHEARATLADLTAKLAKADQPVLNAAGLVELDSAAIAVLLDCRRQAAARGRSLRITGAPPKLSQLAELYGVRVLLDV